MLVYMLYMFLLHAHALYYVLSCIVHTMLVIKCLFRCFCVYLWTPLSTKILGIIMCFHTLPLSMFSCPICTFSHMMHTHTIFDMLNDLYHDYIILLCLASSHVNFFELLFKFQFLGFNS